MGCYLGSGKSLPGRDALDLGNQTLVRLLETNTRVSRADRLRTLIAESGERETNGVIEAKLLRARKAVWMFGHNGSQSIMCGPLALNSISHHQGVEITYPTLGKVTRDYLNTGLPMSELARYASENYNLPALLIRRNDSNASYPVPSVAHLTEEHYIAVLEQNEDATRLFIEDKALGFSGWIDREALDESASGNFLLASSTLPDGYAELSEQQARRIFGRDGNDHGTAPPEEGTNKCSPKDGGDGSKGCGMPTYSFQLFTASLKVEDSPLFAASPYGPDVDFRLTYNEVDGSAPAAAPNCSHVGQDWSTGWVAWMDLPTGGITASTQLKLHAPGSGVYKHSFNPNPNSDLPPLANPHPQSKALLEFTGNAAAGLTEYTRTFSDGSKEIYGHIRAGQAFLSKIEDSVGNQMIFSYHPTQAKLVSVTDSANVVTQIVYGDDEDAFRITEVINRPGTADERKAVLSYDEDGRLESITDMIGLTSSFGYSEGNGFLDEMTTPYGTTRFARKIVGIMGGGGGSRALTATDPMGRTERVFMADSDIYQAPAWPSIPSTVMVAGVSVPFTAPPVSRNTGGGPKFRNTYYWSKKAWKHFELDPTLNPANLATITNWWTSGNYVVEPYAAATKTYGQQWMFFNYPGVTGSGDGAKIVPASGGSVNKVLSFEKVNGVVVPALTQTQYNAASRPTKVTDPLGRVTEISYAANLRDVTEVRQVVGDVKEILGTTTYYPNRLPHVVTDAAGRSTTLTYTTKGQVATVTDNVLSRTTTYNYDSTTGYLDNIDGHLAGAVDLTDVMFDSKGRMIQVISSDGTVVTSTLDDFDRITEVSYLDGTSESFTYDRLHMKEMKDRMGRITKYEVNPLQEVVAVNDPQNLTTIYEWCFCGALQELIDPKGQVTKWSYDEGGRNTRKIYSSGKIDVFNYDSVTGQLVSTTNKLSESGAAFNTKNFSYYLDGSLKTVSYSDSAVATPPVTYTYDSSYGRMATMVDGVGTTAYKYYPTAMVRNAGGTLVANPLLGTSGLPGDANGAGSIYSIDGPWTDDTITQTFDGSGRPLGNFINSVSYGSAMVYDTLDRLTSFSNVIGSYGITYKDVTEGGQTIPTGMVDRMTMKNTSSQTVGYTEYGYDTKANDYRLLSIANRKADDSNVSTFGYTHTAAGRIQTMARTFDSLPTSTYTYGYDRKDQLTSAVLEQSGSPLMHYSYTYDAAGNRTSKQVGSYVSKASHNALNQLQDIQSGGPTRFYGTVDEPSTVTVDGKNAKVDAQNRFEAFLDLAPGTHEVDIVATDGNGNQQTKSYDVTVDTGTPESFTYDDSGNTKTITVGGVTKTFTWDAEDRMVAIEQGDYRTEFVYDGMHRRVKIIEKTLGTVTDEKRLIWAGIRPSEVRDASNNVTRRYVGTGEQRSGTDLFYFRDHLGSIREALNASSELKSRYDYSPYGVREPLTTSITGFVDLEIGFTGHYTYRNDGLGLGQGHELALPWLRAYSANSGRWLSPDPLGEAAGNNLYAYVSNNPINYVDLLGLCQDYGDGVSSGVAGMANELEKSGLVRDTYNEFLKNNLSGQSGYSSERDAARAFFNNPKNSTAISRGIAQADKWSKRNVVKSMANPGMSAANVNRAASLAKYGGRALGVLSVGMAVNNIATSCNKGKTAAQEGGALALGLAGAKGGAILGATIGSVFPGPGTAIGALAGGLIGGISGGIAGHWAGGSIYDWF